MNITCELNIDPKCCQLYIVTTMDAPTLQISVDVRI